MAAPSPQCFPTGSVVWSNCPALNIGCYLYTNDGDEIPIAAGTYADALNCVTVDANGLITSINDCPLFYQVIRVVACGGVTTLVNDYITFIDDPRFTPDFAKFYVDAFDNCTLYQVGSTTAYRTIPSNAIYYEAYTTPSSFNANALCVSSCGGAPQ
jgi:hypothetical protein